MRCIVVSIAAMLAITAAASEARSEPNDLGRGFDLARWIDHGLRLVQKTTPASRKTIPQDVPLELRRPTLLELETSFPTRDPALRDGLVRTGALEFVRPGSMGTSPAIDKGSTLTHEKSALQPSLRMALVARDWKGALSILGRGIMPTDQIRLTRSSRMLIGRVTVGDGPIVPFFHAGVGEWRYDPELLPYMPRNQEFALQVSAGLAFRVAKNVAFAWEADYTMLCRERREPQNAPNPYMFGSFGVLNVEY